MIEQWLGEVSLTTFLGEHYLKRPFSLPDAAARFISSCTWETFGRVLEHEVPPDVLVVQDGELLEVPAPRSLEAARALFAEGCSVVVRGSERHDAGLLELARGFERDLRARVVIQLYATPAAHHSFDWHYDAEEVFILQTAGSKDYFLRENTVNPHPVLEAMPRDMRFGDERSPVMSCTLIPGDWLYVPNGWWHTTEAAEESLSISIGVMPPTGLDVLDRLRRFLVQSPAWRDRLAPPSASRTPFAGQEPTWDHLAGLGQELARLMGDEAFMRLVVGGLEAELLATHQAARCPELRESAAGALERHARQRGGSSLSPLLVG